MANKKTTRRALFVSVMSLILCCAMLMGTTFAWFTDSVTSGGSTIQAGNLDITFEKYTNGLWVDAEGETIKFRPHPDSNVTADNILWEPGCTYWMEQIRVRNTGNLALKYDIVISGATGDTELLDVIKFEYAAGEGWKPLDTIKGNLIPGAESTGILLRAHMDEDAGNEYKNLKLEDISFTVSAQQLPYEYDSLSNQYDAGVEALAGAWVQDATSRTQIGVEITHIKGITDVNSFYVNILDASGNVLTKITPTEKTITNEVKDGVLSAITSCAIISGSDSSSWDNTWNEPLDANNAPVKAVLFVNGVEKGNCDITQIIPWAAAITKYN